MSQNNHLIRVWMVGSFLEQREGEVYLIVSLFNIFQARFKEFGDGGLSMYT